MLDGICFPEMDEYLFLSWAYIQQYLQVISSKTQCKDSNGQSICASISITTGQLCQYLASILYIS